MAGDWIKMRIGLMDDPAVIEMASSLGISEQEVIGNLHAIWSWASRNSHDGSVTGVRASDLKRVTRCTCDVPSKMEVVGWLIEDNTGDRPVLHFPKWDRHNSKSAKTRELATIRKQRQRDGEADENVTQESRSERDKSVTREEKRRGIKEKEIQKKKKPSLDGSSSGSQNGQKRRHDYPDDFEAWWTHYPKKTGKRAAFQQWKAAAKLVGKSKLLEMVEKYARSDKGLGDRQYIPDPERWLKRGMYDDDPESWSIQPQRFRVASDEELKNWTP